MSEAPPFLWETHGIHVGTGQDHVKHGIDELEPVVEQAMRRGFPSVTFVIHTPRLTRFRYRAERETMVKFIRGDAAYFGFTRRMEELRDKYRGGISLRYGVELEWMGPGLGLQWGRSKLFQAYGADFVLGSVHFSSEGIPYDYSKEDTDELIRRRGGLESFWAGYLDEVIEMVDASWEMIHVVSHLDLPKLFAPVPEPLRNLDSSSHFLARRARTLLEMVSDLNLALDVNTAGLRKGSGLFPDPHLLERACQLRIPIAIGSDAHQPEDIGRDYGEVVQAARRAGYRWYVSFSRGITETRPLSAGGEGSSGAPWPADPESASRLRRRPSSPRRHIQELLEDFRLGPGPVQRGAVRRDDRSITLSDRRCRATAAS
jgi:histidinol-phosphatase (PHP family)